MIPLQNFEMTEFVLTNLKPEEVNKAAKQLCSHIVNLNSEQPSLVKGPLIAVACTPKESVECDETTLCETIYEACQIPVEPIEDVSVPHTLIPKEEIETSLQNNQPKWLPGQFTDGTPPTPADKLTRPFSLRRFENGIRIGVAKIDFESQRGHLRIVAPGGRDAEKRFQFKKGSMAVGARTMQV